MKFADALKLVNESGRREGQSFRAAVACGFSAHHVKTFLHAHLLRRLPDRAVTVETGLYGDLAGNVRKLCGENPDAAAVMIEWSDLDARLGYRSSHGWRPDRLPDILSTASARLDHLRREIERLAQTSIVAISLPHAPLPPAFNTPVAWGNSIGFSLQERLFAFAAALSENVMVRILNPQTVERLSAADERFDLQAELWSGFPYPLPHASMLCCKLVDLLLPPPSKKAIITDLDNTLWRGILGDDGVEGISWSLDAHTHAHALYQEMLASLGQLGVLVGIASKNDPQLVEQALRREDLVVPPELFFPIDVHWGAKSHSVRRILEAWNIGADSVVLVDDSPMEIAEVREAFPEVEGIVFPVGDDKAVLAVLEKLRNLCGKHTVTDEDRLRASSLRAARSYEVVAAESTSDEFLSQLNGEITVIRDQPDPRTFELINKTNQFNLNGRRIDESSWRSRLADPRHFLVAASYKDKFGPLGKISVVAGFRDAEEPVVDIWVMSCRAFSRSIEHHILRTLFQALHVDLVRFDHVPTERNGPLCEFLEMFAERRGDGALVIRKADFLAKCPQLYSKVVGQ
jgi:FkbH-like protein